ncbi:MAG: DNA mismatch repair protein MutS [Lachnospiraceae bacterium]|nr:DNA mismatch repair protein MutS [Lachnospiraceae bacterium]
MPDINDVSPMMQNYLETKKQYPDSILFYRIGDFYEMFFDDAVQVSRELELVLTGKSCGLEERAPMCGVPFHAADTYISRLVSKGYKVAICEQVEDPKLAKGLVKREVIKVVTPGTNINSLTLDSGRNNYLMCICYQDNEIGISVVDVSTGEFLVSEVSSVNQIGDFLGRFEPSEIICNNAFSVQSDLLNSIKERFNIPVTVLDNAVFEEKTATGEVLRQFKVKSLIGLGLDSMIPGVLAAGASLIYLHDTQKTDLGNLSEIHPYIADKYMMLDSSSRRNLELTETIRDKQKKGSLLGVLDRTKTAMGGRLLRTFLEQPLIDESEIIKRQEAISAFNANTIARDELREYLTPVYDLERLLAKVSFGTATPPDLLSLASSLQMLPHIKTVLEDVHSEEIDVLKERFDILADIESLITNAIKEEPETTIRDGNIIKDGFNEEVDRLRSAKTEGKGWLAQLEEAEKERTGIKGLKIKFHKSFGYFFEVTNSYLDKVPEDFIRRQTLTTCERFTSVKLKELEDSVLNADEKIRNLEYDLFCQIRNTVGAESERILKTAKCIAFLDVYTDLAYIAEVNRYVKPHINTKGIINIKEGRHPVVEKMLGGELFVSNDTYLDNSSNLVSIITGPNMAGKSTYMRQTALIVLMSQIGSYVPATSADLCVVDRIFTRVGASDDLASGQSTFMIEMNEVSNILRNATSKSLLILDEIGRGTSTFDGLAIAWAVIEHISNKRIIGAKTLFATHYHELTELEGKIDNVHNYCIAVKESGDDIVFLRKIIKGGADRSYGIQVAKLAGVPDIVIDRAKEIASSLALQDISTIVESIAAGDQGSGKIKKVTKPDEVDSGQLSFFDLVSDEDLLKEIEEIDIQNLTPLDALNKDKRASYKIIGQVFDTYWIVQYEQQMFIIDQHAAHEKVNYERFVKRIHAGEHPTQMLMPPIIVTLTGAEESVLK